MNKTTGALRWVLVIIALVSITTIYVEQNKESVIILNGREITASHIGTMEYQDAETLVKYSDEADVHLIVLSSLCGESELGTCDYDLPVDVWLRTSDKKDFVRDVCPFISENKLAICQ